MLMLLVLMLVLMLVRFSALQRAEIAEMNGEIIEVDAERVFQCSSTSRNC